MVVGPSMTFLGSAPAAASSPWWAWMRGWPQSWSLRSNHGVRRL